MDNFLGGVEYIRLIKLFINIITKKHCLHALAMSSGNKYVGILFRSN